LFRRGRTIGGGGISEFRVSPFAIAAGGISLGTVLSPFGVLSLSVSGSALPGGVEGPSGGVMEGVEGRDMRTRHDEVMLPDEKLEAKRETNRKNWKDRPVIQAQMHPSQSVNQKFGKPYNFINSRNTNLCSILLLMYSRI